MNYIYPIALVIGSILLRFLIVSDLEGIEDKMLFAYGGAFFAAILFAVGVFLVFKDSLRVKKLGCVWIVSSVVIFLLFEIG